MVYQRERKESITTTELKLLKFKERRLQGLVSCKESWQVLPFSSLQAHVSIEKRICNTKTQQSIPDSHAGAGQAKYKM